MKLPFAIAALLAAVVAHATPITTGATVTLNGTFFTGNGGWSLGSNATPQDLVDGVFQPEHQQWNFNSVWWNGNDHPGNSIVLNLNGTFSITGFKVQTDDNDTYRIDYLAPGSSLWTTAWTISPPGGYGLTTSSTTLGSPITATDLRVEAMNGDGYYAVSQVEGFGSSVATVPDSSSTLGLVGLALALLAMSRRFRKR